jgi:hypothetical protein
MVLAAAASKSVLAPQDFLHKARALRRWSNLPATSHREWTKRRGTVSQLIADIQSAMKVIKRLGLERAVGASSSLPPNVQSWVEYAWVVKTDRQNDERVQRRLWDAHQASLHMGIREAAALLPQETAHEQRFIKQVVRNVDTAALIVLPTNDVAVGFYVSNVYPDRYGGGQPTNGQLKAIEAAATERLFACGSEPFGAPGYGCASAATRKNIGINSTRW